MLNTVPFSNDGTTPEERAIIRISELKAVLSLFSGLVLETCGTWLWVSGNTKENKEMLKSLGFHYAAKKQMWYWNSREIDYKPHRPMAMSHIRAKYLTDTTVTSDNASTASV